MTDSSVAGDREAPAYPTFAETTRTWAKIGLLSFGGPAGQIALMHKILVTEKRWISEERFLHALNYCMLLPGPEAQQLATYVGWLLHGVRGGVVAGTLFVLPGFFVILGLSIVYASYASLPAVEAVFFGLKAAVLVIVVEALLRISRRALANGLMWILAVGAFLALFVFAVPFPVVILLAALIGYVGYRLRPDVFAAKPHHAAAAGVAVKTLDLRRPDAPRTVSRALLTIFTWGALWIAPVLLLWAIFGRGTVFTPIAWFFSQMAVVTFGGAYAVLAYVAQETVTGFGWLRPGEMLDGLAMAETTPGPLIMVLTFVGFLAAFRAAPGIDPLLSGTIGAVLTTWVTFIPCFLWIFLGAPYIERLRANKALSGALAAVTAAVVGVILNLAIWFGLHVLFAEVATWRSGPISMAVPNWSTLDPWGLALTGVAAVILLGLRWGIVPTLAICAGLGLVLRQLGLGA